MEFMHRVTRKTTALTLQILRISHYIKPTIISINTTCSSYCSHPFTDTDPWAGKRQVMAGVLSPLHPLTKHLCNCHVLVLYVWSIFVVTLWCVMYLYTYVRLCTDLERTVKNPSINHIFTFPLDLYSCLPCVCNKWISPIKAHLMLLISTHLTRRLCFYQ